MARSRCELSDVYEAQDLIIAAAQDVKREATKAYREFLDGRGMDKDAIKAEVEGFKKAFRRKMEGQKKGAEAVEHVDAIADEIYLEITSRAPRATRVAIDVPSFVAFASNGSEYEYDAETGEITEPQPTKAAGQDGGAVSAVKGANARLENAVGVEPPPSTNPQAAPQPESDLTNLPSPQGQVAAIQESPRKAAEAEGESPALQVDASAPAEAGIDGQPSLTPATTDRTVGVNVGGLDGQGVTAGETAPITYPAPGIVTMEHTPPEGIVAHPFAAVWPVNNVDVSEGVREPIVKIGKLILDGRGRYFAARAECIEYPVVQYDGTDPLMDSIRWNLASRPGLHPHNLKNIAHKLAKLEPSRADEIMAAFGVKTEEAA